MKNCYYFTKSFLAFSLFSCITALVFSGCGSSKDDEDGLLLPEFFIESRGGVQLSQPTYATLPISRSQFEVFPAPVIRHNHITGVAKAKVDLGYCLAFQLNSRGALRFQGISADNIGSRLILMVSRQALGVRVIDGVISNGRIFIFVEYPDEELDELVAELTESIIKIQEKEMGSNRDRKNDL